MAKNSYKRFLALASLVLTCAEAFGQAPNIMTYQGRLKESGQPANGARTVQFRLCTDAAGTSCFNTSPNTQNVTASNGLFRSTFAVPSSINMASYGPWYLELNVDGNVYLPREQLTSVPYAIYAATASSLAAPQDAAGIVISTNVFVAAGGKYYGDGSGLTNIGSDNTKVAKAGDTMTGPLAINGGNFYLNGTTFAANGVNFGIGTANPQYPFHVAVNGYNPAVVFTSTNSTGLIIERTSNTDGEPSVMFQSWSSSQGGLRLKSDMRAMPGGDLTFGTSNNGAAPLTRRMTISAAGSVGISTGVPQARLDVLAAGSSATDMAQIWRNASGVIQASMSATGVMKAAKFIGDGSGLTGISASGGDNLGNHVATTTLNMANFGITNAGGISASSAAISGAFSVAGSTLSVVNGYVGIGTTNPQFPLHVAVSSPFFAPAFFSNDYSDPSLGFNLIMDNSGPSDVDMRLAFQSWSDSQGGKRVKGYMGFAPGGDIVFDTTNNGAGGYIHRMRITAAGNVGISTNAPQARLDVLASGSNPTDMSQIWRNSSGVIQASMSATGVMKAAKFIGDGSGLTGISASGGDNLGNHVATTTLNMANFGITNAGGISASSASISGAFSVAGSTLSVVNGFVGIGTQNPQYPLHVVGSTASITAVFSNYDPYPTNGASVIFDNTASNDVDMKIAFQSWSDSQGGKRVKGYMGFAPGGDMVFDTTNNGAVGYIHRMRITAAGNVGISTNAPQARLDVLAAGSSATDMAQIWRNSSGVIQASMSATGVMKAKSFVGDGSFGNITVSTITVGNAVIARLPVQAADTGIVLTQTEFGKVITVDSGSDQIVTLPAVSAADIGASYTIVKLGAGKVTIQAQAGTYIADSTQGGTIYNAAGVSYAAIKLVLVTESRWAAFAGYGTWSAN